MADDKLNAIEKQIAALQKEREKLLSDPKREEVRALYGELDQILNRLSELGEDVSNGDGYVITIIGTRFSYTHGVGLKAR